MQGRQITALKGQEELEVQRAELLEVKRQVDKRARLVKAKIVKAKES